MWKVHKWMNEQTDGRTDGHQILFTWNCFLFGHLFLYFDSKRGTITICIVNFDRYKVNLNDFSMNVLAVEMMPQNWRIAFLVKIHLICSVRQSLLQYTGYTFPQPFSLHIFLNWYKNYSSSFTALIDVQKKIKFRYYLPWATKKSAKYWDTLMAWASWLMWAFDFHTKLFFSGCHCTAYTGYLYAEEK